MALNSQQIDPGETDILSQIGGALSQLLGGAFGGQQDPAGYEWDALQGWVPKAGAQPAPTGPAAPKAPEPWHAPMTGAPAYNGPPVSEPAPHAPMANMPPYSGPLPQPKPAAGAMGQKPHTVIPTQETQPFSAGPLPGGPAASASPLSKAKATPNMFQRSPMG